MQALPESLSIAQEIQLSVAPVFMLTAIAALLTLLFNRMSQTQDQIRALGELPKGEGTAAEPDKAVSRLLAARVSRIRWAIRCNATAAILICSVVVSIFVGDYLVPDLSNLIAVLFIAAMTLLATGFMLLLRDVSKS
jgi:Ni/Fe-hydrogenase subunit HybB-like protein